jgi:predicted ferric reductase
MLSFLVGTSTILLRKRAYELFLIIHIVLAIVFVYAIFDHMSHFGSEFTPYLWPVVVIWAFDRLMRLIRLLACNLPMFLGRREMKESQSSVSYDKEADMIRLEVPIDHMITKPDPGQHYFIYQPTFWKGWENHPFTLAGWRYSEGGRSISITPTVASSEGSLGSSISPVESEDNKEKEVGSSDLNISKPITSQNSSEARSAPGQQGVNRLTFLIRPFDGWTKHLRNKCIKSADGTYSSRMLIEGPYGQRAPFHNFHTVVLIVGGSGITGVLSYVQDHLERTKSTPEQTSTVNLHLVWACKQPAFISHVCQNELLPAMLSGKVKIDLYSTQGGQLSSLASPSVTVISGRPDVPNIIHTASNSSSDELSSIAVLVCGPGALADQARMAVHGAMKTGTRPIRYFEESFGW